ncbi:MAG TPA: shikimate dehydrogenase [Candidatus Dormibacteraeota bacterium]|nr:shikimate dehydrogenase [Candidatus Dormibacteraeota bacterium]
MTVEVALVGDPVGHSLSPAIQAAAFAALDLDWQYQLVRVPAGGLAGVWPELKHRFRGVNVTSPHKQEAARLADALSPTARICASVNTLTFSSTGAFGDSTDGAGFLAALRGGTGCLPHKAVVAGTGGAARAVCAALLTEGAEVEVLGRNLLAGAALAAELAGIGLGVVAFRGDGDAAMKQALDGAELLVNATTLGGPRFSERSPVSAAVELRSDLVVFDLVYWPRWTPLRRRAREAGCHLVDGLEMLVEQGAMAFQAWTGKSAPISVMREAAKGAIETLP